MARVIVGLWCALAIGCDGSAPEPYLQQCVPTERDSCPWPYECVYFAEAQVDVCARRCETDLQCPEDDFSCNGDTSYFPGFPIHYCFSRI